MKEKKLKLYYAQWADDDDSCMAVIAYNINEAKKLARENENMQTWFTEGCFDFIDLRVHWAKKNKDVDLSKYKHPFVAQCDDDEDAIEFMKNGIYGGCMMECPQCHGEDFCYYHKDVDKAMCSECEEKLIEERQNKPKEVDTV